MSRPLFRSMLELRPRCASPLTLASRRLFASTPSVLDAPLEKTPKPNSPPKAKPSQPKKLQQAENQRQQQQAAQPEDQYPKIIPRKQGIKHKHPLIINPPKPGPAFGPPELSPAKPRHPSITALLPVLAAQPSRYITVHIFDRPYLVTAGDEVRLPFLMQGVLPGDVLRLNRASVLGSRDYTLKGAPYIDERLFECRATVLGSDSEPMRYKLKTKQRNRKTKTVKSKHRYTLLRISEVKVVVPEEEESTAQASIAQASTGETSSMGQTTAEGAVDLATIGKAVGRSGGEALRA